VAAPKTKPSFEDLYRQLEETVTRLEQGGLSLDDSLAAYEEAVKLARSCQQLLGHAELRIKKLRQSLDGDEPEVAIEEDDEEG
jgi:exodeoxyribonuclease VII small subunit